MKFRTSVFFACMIVVPALALFSHRLPADVRAKVRSCVWEPVEAWAASLTRSTKTVASDPGVDDTQPPGVAASHLPAEVVAPPAAVGSVAMPAATSPSPSVAPMPASPDNRSGLASLGAMAIDCRPFDGAAGTHVASCRVAVDASGQLHRVFQAAGRSSEEAIAGLEQAVRAWQSRRATTARVGGAEFRL